MTLENNLEYTVSTIPTNIDTILYNDINNDGPSQVEERQVEETLPDMNFMYPTAMNVEGEC